MSKLEQAIVSLSIRLGVLVGLVLLDALSKSISGFVLPDPALTIPVLTLVISEADTWLVNYAKTNNIPTDVPVSPGV